MFIFLTGIYLCIKKLDTNFFKHLYVDTVGVFFRRVYKLLFRDCSNSDSVRNMYGVCSFVQKVKMFEKIRRKSVLINIYMAFLIYNQRF